MLTRVKEIWGFDNKIPFNLGPEANLVYLLHEYKSCRSEVVAQRLKFEESYARIFPVAKPIQQKRPILSEYDANSIEKRRKLV